MSCWSLWGCNSLGWPWWGRVSMSPPKPLSAPVYTVVLHLKNELNRGTFFMTLQNQPVALSLYRQVGAVPAVTPP